MVRPLGGFTSFYMSPQLPLDSNTLPEEERRARLRRHFPSKPKAEPEETFEGIDLDTYKKFWKK